MAFRMAVNLLRADAPPSSPSLKVSVFRMLLSSVYRANVILSAFSCS